MVEVEMSHEEGVKPKKKLGDRFKSYLEEKGKSYKEKKAYERTPQGRQEKIKNLRDELEMQKLRNNLKKERNPSYAPSGFGGGGIGGMQPPTSMFGGSSLFGGPPKLQGSRVAKRKRKKSKRPQKGKSPGYVIIGGKAYPKG